MITPAKYLSYHSCYANVGTMITPAKYLSYHSCYAYVGTMITPAQDLSYHSCYACVGLCTVCHFHRIYNTSSLFMRLSCIMVRCFE